MHIGPLATSYREGRDEVKAEANYLCLSSGINFKNSLGWSEEEEYYRIGGGDLSLPILAALATPKLAERGSLS